MLSGEGKAFCSGRDLSDAEPATEDPQSILADTFNPLFSRIRYLDLPTFAAVHGACLGVGLGIALACDVTIAADSARLGSPFARIGAVLDSGGHHHLVHRFGEHRALELVYTGRLLNGTEATEWDLVNQRCRMTSCSTRRWPSPDGLPRARHRRSGCRSGSRIASPTPP